VGLLSALESLAQHRLLDRLIRGRVWIGLVAFALIGIVTLQLGLLKLNGGIGRALEHEALLQRENATLSIENSELVAGTRVEAHAAKLGMAFVPAGALRFLSADGHGAVGKAAAALASAAHEATQAREASAAESRAAAETEASGEAAGAAEGSSESEAGSEVGASEEAAGASVESSAGSESGASESSTSDSPAAEAESSSAASSEAEPSGGISASAAGE
jgi:cell division protein FtsL